MNLETAGVVVKHLDCKTEKTRQLKAGGFDSLRSDEGIIKLKQAGWTKWSILAFGLPFYHAVIDVCWSSSYFPKKLMMSCDLSDSLCLSRFLSLSLSVPLFLCFTLPLSSSIHPSIHETDVQPSVYLCHEHLSICHKTWHDLLVTSLSIPLCRET